MGSEKREEKREKREERREEKRKERVRCEFCGTHTNSMHFNRYCY